MTPVKLSLHSEQVVPERPIRIATWLARQGYFIATWSLWEFYARGLRESLPKIERKGCNESTVDWVSRSLSSNGVAFSDQIWFASANCLRNLIAHNGARACGAKAEKLLDRSRTAFPHINTWRDRYIEITHCDVADLHIKIEDFIDQTA